MGRGPRSVSGTSPYCAGSDLEMGSIPGGRSAEWPTAFTAVLLGGADFPLHLASSRGVNYPAGSARRKVMVRDGAVFRPNSTRSILELGDFPIQQWVTSNKGLTVQPRFAKYLTVMGKQMESTCRKTMGFFGH
ncbi:hypothetical protein FKM82_028875 [Ascaphus truei]